MFEKNTPVEEVFSAAWQQVRAGRSIESVTASLPPDQAAELEPMLRLATAMQAVPAPNLPPQALDQIQKRALHAASMPRVPRPGSKVLRYGVPSGATTADLWLGTQRLGWLTRLFPTPRRTVSVLALLVIVAGIAISAAVLMNKAPAGEPVESYSGVIKELTATRWLVGDTQVVIDPATEIHGHPVLGAQITCLAVALQPGDRVRALEVWVRSGPQTPTAVPSGPSGETSTPAMALAP
jgi:hypothetical protein